MRAHHDHQLRPDCTFSTAYLPGWQQSWSLTIPSITATNKTLRRFNVVPPSVSGASTLGLLPSAIGRSPSPAGLSVDFSSAVDAGDRPQRAGGMASRLRTSVAFASVRIHLMSSTAAMNNNTTDLAGQNVRRTTARRQPWMAGSPEVARQDPLFDENLTPFVRDWRDKDQHD